MNLGVYDQGRAWVERYRLGGNVLEVGARSVNGSLRSLFGGLPGVPDTYRATSYLGLDLEPGPGVDIVADVLTFDLTAEARWDGIVCTEVLEHVPDPEALLRAVRRLTFPGGWLVLSTRSPGFPFHAYPLDNDLRWTRWTLAELLMRTGWNPLDVVDDPTPNEPGVMALALRRR